MKIYFPAYYRDFKCIASSCPDSCCHGWTVDIDDAAAARYLALPGGLGDKLRRHLKREDWGWVLTLEENGRCPMWREDGLCRIHAEAGEEMLSHVCAAFPRLRHDYGSFRELGLELSCPEAARLIFARDSFALTEEDLPGDEAPDYDEEAMAVLLRTRRELVDFIAAKQLPMAETLAVTLLYGYAAQEELDGGEPAAMDANSCLAAARECAGGGDSASLLDFFRGLEILTPQWERRLSDAIKRSCHPERAKRAEGSVTATVESAPLSGALPEVLRPMLVYFLERYYLQAVADYDIVCRVKLAVVSCLAVALLGGDPVTTAQQYSKEIENDPDNVEAILDGAYTAPALTDRNLLGLLLNNS